MTRLNQYQVRFAAAVTAGLALSILIVVTSLVDAAASFQGYF